MSEDYVNQLTLNFLISKSQLEKLNKKRNNDKQTGLQIDKTKFREPVLELFNRLFDDDAPTDLLHDVRDSFDLFITKSIYYLKIREQDALKEDELVEDLDTVLEQEDEADELVEDLDLDDDEQDDELDLDLDDVPVDEEPIVTKVYKKRPPKTKLTPGSESIQKLPLDWFNNTRQNYKMTQILPRKKEIIINSEAESDKK
jgi:hypothetical protein